MNASISYYILRKETIYNIMQEKLNVVIRYFSRLAEIRQLHLRNSDAKGQEKEFNNTRKTTIIIQAESIIRLE